MKKGGQTPVVHCFFTEEGEKLPELIIKSLICTADKIQHVLPAGILSIEHRQRIAAFMAKNQPFQQKIVGTASGMSAAIEQHLHLLKGLFVDKRFMGTFYHHPIFRCLPDTFWGFIADFYAASLHHVANVGFILQYIGDPFTAPLAGVRSGSGHG